MAAELFTLPFRPAFNVRGIPLPGAKLYFYYSGGLTPAPIYLDSALSVAAANPVVADAAGRWTNIYLNDAISYRVVVKTSADVVVPGHDVDPYYANLAEDALTDIATLQSDFVALAGQLPPNGLNSPFNADFTAPAYFEGETTVASFAAWLTELSGTYTRGGSQHYYYNSSGVLANGSANAQRITYDPITLEKQGMLYEPSRTNLFWSYAPSAPSGPWFYSSTALTVAGMAATGVDGTTSATTLRETTATSQHLMQYYDAGISLTSGASYALQFLVKGVSRTKFRLSFPAIWGAPGPSTGGYTLVDVDLSAKTITSGWTIEGPFAANGEYRISCVATATSSGTPSPAFQVYMKDDTGALSYTGNAAKGINISLAQAEAGSAITSPIIRVDATAATRSADALTITVPAGSISYTFDNRDIQVVTVSAGSYAVPTTLDRSILREIIAADMTDYAGVTSFAGRKGDVTPVQADIVGLRTTDGPVFASVGVGFATLYTPNTVFLSFSNITEGALTNPNDARGLRFGTNAANSAATFLNAMVMGPDAAKTATYIATSTVLNDTACSLATTIVGSEIIGNEAGNHLTGTVSASIIIGNLAVAAAGKTSTNGVTVGAEASRWNGSSSSVVLGYKAGYGNTANKGTLTNHVLIGALAGDSLEGNRTGNTLIGYNVDAPTATTDNYFNLDNILYGSKATNTYTLVASGLTLASLPTTDPGVAGRVWNSGGRVVVSGSAPPIDSYIRQDANYTLANSTSVQKLFNTTTNGRLTLPTGVYEFESMFAITGMDPTSGNASFDLLGAGTATLAGQLFQTVGVDSTTALSTAANRTGMGVNGANATPANSLAGATGTAMVEQVRGMFKCTVAGTIIPSIALVTAIGTAVVEEGSWLKVRRVADLGTNSRGSWD